MTRRDTPPPQQVKSTSFEIVPVSLTKISAPAGELNLSWTRLEALEFGLEDYRDFRQRDFNHKVYFFKCLTATVSSNASRKQQRFQ